MRVLRLDEKLAALPKPPLQAIERITLESADCLVVSAGCAETAPAVLENAISGSVPFKVVIVEYSSPVPQNSSPIIREKCAQYGLPSSEIPYDSQNPSGFGESLLGRLADCTGRIFVDVSGMSRLLIVQAIVAMGKRVAGFKDCVLVYADTKPYSPSQNEAETAIARSIDPTYATLFFSPGMFEVTIVPELSSTAIPASQTRLVVFPSFSSEQLTALKNELAPSRCAFIHGVPPQDENKWHTEAIARLNRIDLASPNSVQTSTLDYRDTLNCLLRLYGMHSEHERLLVSPTGSKMQAVAVGLFRSFIHDVQIVYPTPEESRSPTNCTMDVRQLYTLPLSEFVTAIA